MRRIHSTVDWISQNRRISFESKHVSSTSQAVNRLATDCLKALSSNLLPRLEITTAYGEAHGLGAFRLRQHEPKPRDLALRLEPFHEGDPHHVQGVKTVVVLLFPAQEMNESGQQSPQIGTSRLLTGQSGFTRRGGVCGCMML